MKKRRGAAEVAVSREDGDAAEEAVESESSDAAGSRWFWRFSRFESISKNDSSILLSLSVYLCRILPRRSSSSSSFSISSPATVAAGGDGAEN